MSDYSPQSLGDEALCVLTQILPCSDTAMFFRLEVVLLLVCQEFQSDTNDVQRSKYPICKGKCRGCIVVQSCQNRQGEQKNQHILIGRDKNKLNAIQTRGLSKPGRLRRIPQR